MFRLYDTQQHEVAEIRPARTGLLRVHLEGPGLAPGQLDELRSYLLADLIRRNGERYGNSVIVCQDAADIGGLPGAERIALSIAPPDFDCEAPSGPAGSGAVDVGIRHVGASAAAGVWQAGQDSDAAETRPSAGHREARCWVRTGPVLFDGRDVAAPGPNTRGPEGVLLAAVSARGLDPLAVRLALLEARYRDQLNLTWDLLGTADAEVRRWRELVATCANEPSKPICAEYWARFADALDDDLDTPAALAALRDLAADSEIPAGSKFETFAAGDRVLGLELVSLVGKLPA
jgi:cysteinyl-tRNA synthetase